MAGRERAKKTIAVVSNMASNIFIFKMNFVKYLKEKNYNVIVFAHDNGFGTDIEKIADKYIDYNISRTGVNVFQEYKTYRELASQLRIHNPDVLISFTIKPNLYSNLIFRNRKTKVINVVTGRGRVFSGKNPLRRKLIGALSKVSYKKSDKIVLNNPADYKYCIENKYIEKSKATIIYGEGVDLKRFSTVREKNNERIKFLFIGRLMISKGILDFIEAGLKAKEMNPKIDIQVAGQIIDNDDDAISRDVLNSFIKENKITYFQHRKNPMSFFEEASCVVLPTYYNEGMPKSLMEAAAMKTPVICSDLDACKQVVDDGVTGYLCRAKDRDLLSKTLLKFANLHESEKLTMGLEARKKAEREFDVHDINEQYHNLILEMLETR